MKAAEIITHIPDSWIQAVARVGMASKGAVYGLAGLMTLLFTVGAFKQPIDMRGALGQLDEFVLGEVLLVFLGFGLWAYGLWRLMQALYDPSNPDKNKKRWLKRAGYLGSAAVHFSLGYFSFKEGLGLGNQNGDSDENTRRATTQAMHLPWGQVLIGAVGAGFLAYALAQVYLAVTDKTEERLHQHKMSAREMKWAKVSATCGFFARGVVFGVLGVYLVKSALNLDPREAVGIKGTLELLSQQPVGPWPLGLVSIGLIGYGVFMLVQARYRKVHTP